MCTKYITDYSCRHRYEEIKRCSQMAKVNRYCDMRLWFWETEGFDKGCVMCGGKGEANRRL
jgi:hypothetical protein